MSEAVSWSFAARCAWGYAAEAPEARPRMELSELMVPVGGNAAVDLEKETP